MELEIGQNVDRYTVETILGEGACGVVYRVRHPNIVPVTDIIGTPGLIGEYIGAVR